MKKTIKIYIILTLLTLGSLGCSNNSTQNTLLDISSVIENPTEGKEVTLQGKIVGKIEKCHVFTDGTDKILVHFKDEELSYDPNTTVEISGTIERGIMPGMHHFRGKNHGVIPMDTMIMVSQLQVITAKE